MCIYSILKITVTVDMSRYNKTTSRFTKRSYINSYACLLEIHISSIIDKELN